MEKILAPTRDWVLRGLAGLAGRPRSERRAMAVAMDAVFCAVAAVFAMYLRMGSWSFEVRPLLWLVACAVCLWFPIAHARRVYSSLLRFAGGRTMMGLALAVGIFAGPMILLFMLVSVPGVPRTMGLLHPLVFLALLCLSRLVLRFALVDVLGVGGTGPRLDRRVAIYGAGRAGQQLAMALRHEQHMQLVAFLDDDRRLDNQLIDGVPVFSRDQHEDVLAELSITEVLLAIPSATRSRRREIVEYLSRKSLAVRSLPSFGNIIEGDVAVSDLKEVQIEDLLGRDAVAPNELLMSKNITGKVVAVTGAGGSIGSELCRQILACRPASVLLVEQSELALYQIERELRTTLESRGVSISLNAELCNVADAASIARVFKRHRPQTVFHAAAYKHVPLVEINPISGLRNNIVGTYNTCVAAEAVGVSHFILISTDKAVRPTNVMGASKRVCELVLQARSSAQKDTNFSMVRFGNVMGSSGSVVPLFKQQISNGGPVTITDRRVTRYFMTIPEAAQLVIQAGAMAKGGEVFVLEMGNPVQIYDLARTMIELCGLSVRTPDRPDGDIEIVEVGLRPGEKLYEELLIGNNPKPSRHDRIIQAEEHFLPWPKLKMQLDKLTINLDRGDDAGALEILRALVPEYEPGATIIDRPSQMA